MEKTIIVFHRMGSLSYPVAAITVEPTDDPIHKFEVAWERTNTHDSYWPMNPEVTMLMGGVMRSTSVGDVMLCGSELVMVAVVGFMPLPKTFLTSSLLTLGDIRSIL